MVNPPLEPTRRPRYPGSVPFDDNEVDRRLFFGRGDDADAILHAILSHDLFVLYARSGIGKTSLLRARIVHELRARGLWPVMVRLNLSDREPVELVREALLQQNERGDVEVLGAEAPVDSLWALMSGLEIWRGDELQVPVMVFDQFEEIFTRWDPERRQRFISQFADVARGTPPRPREGEAAVSVDVLPRLKIVLALREDFLGELEAFSTVIPRILSHRYRLEPLTQTQAGDAIREPAALEDIELASPPFRYSGDAVKRIVDFLSEETHGEHAVHSDAVEAFQLQIVCHYIEDTLVPEIGPSDSSIPVVSADHLRGEHDLEGILTDFYRREVEEFGSRSDRRRIQRLCETGLISSAGRRLSLEREQIHDEHGVTEEQLEHLVQRRLLRAEPRVGSVYYELAHDSLVQPLTDFHDERRRQTRRRALLAGAILAAVVLAIVVFVFAQRLAESGEIRSLDVGDEARGEIERTDEVDSFEFRGQAGDVVTLSLESDSESDLVGVIEVTGLSADDAEPDDETDAAPAGSLTFRLPFDGAYLVGVRSADGSVGSYRLRLGSVAVTPLEQGQPASVSVAAGEVRAFSFDAQAQASVTLSVEAEGDLAGVLEVDGPTTTRAEIGAAGVAEAVDRLTFVTPSNTSTDDTTYVVLVRAVTPGTLGISWRLGNVETVGDRDTLGASLGAEGETDVFEITGSAGDAVTIVLDPGGQLDASMDVIDPAGTRLASLDATGPGGKESATLVLLTDGRYRVYARGRGELPGEYSISLRSSAVGALDDQQPASGEIRLDADVQAHEFQGRAGETVTITLDPSVDLDGVLEVVGPSSSRLALIDDGPASVDESATLVLADDGTHLVLLRGAGRTVGTFALSLDRPDVRPLEAGAPRDGGLDGADTIDVFSVAGVAGEAITLTMVPSDSLDGVVELIDGSSARLELLDSAGPGGAEAATVVIREDERLLVRASAADGTAGEYSLVLARTPVAVLDDTASIDGTISSESEVQVAEFGGNAGEAVVVSMVPDDGLNAVFEVLDPSSRRIAEVDSEGPGTAESTLMVLPADGTYTVLASGFLDSSGSYALRLARADVIELTENEAEEGEIEAADRIAVYRLRAAADDVVTFGVEPAGALNPALELLGTTSDRIAFVDSGGSAAAETLTVTLPDDGTYHLVVRGFAGSVGGFSVIADRSVLDVVDIGEPVLGEIGEPGEVDSFQFAGAAGDSATIAVEVLGDLDPVIEVIDPDTNQVALVDSGSSGRDESTNLILPRGGNYLVLVRGLSNTTGEYRLVVELAAVEPISVGQTVSAGIDRFGQVDVYEFDGELNQIVDFILAVPDEDLTPVIELIMPPPSEDVIVQGDPGAGPGFIQQLPKDDTYYVKVWGLNGSTGDYRLTLIEAAPLDAVSLDTGG